MRLEHGFHHLKRSGPVEIGALLGHHFQIRIAVDHAMEPAGSVPRIVVAHETEQFDVGPFLAHDLYEMLSERDATGVVVGQDLRDGGVGGVDLAVHAKDRNPRRFRPAHIGDGTVCVGGIEQNGPVSGGDDVFKVGGFFCGIVLGIEDGRFVPEFPGPIPCGLAEHDEPGIVQGRDHDSHASRTSGVGGGRRGGVAGREEPDQRQSRRREPD